LQREKERRKEEREERGDKKRRVREGKGREGKGEARVPYRHCFLFHFAQLAAYCLKSITPVSL